MTQKTPFSLFDASAGSGKTFQLVVQYLSLCLASPQPDFYQRVLAITFTNKAAAEMKERILATLDRMVEGNRDGEVAFIEEKTQLSFENLQARALAMRTDILHNYHSFSISTIDYFTHKVIRTFAHDLKLPHAFEIELDVKQMRLEAIENVLSKVGENPELTKALMTYVKEQLKNNKSWKVERPLLEISSIINEENSIQPLQELKKQELSSFLEAQKKISENRARLKAEFEALAKEGLQLIEGIEPSAFHSGSRGGIPSTFKKWGNLDMSPLVKTTLAFFDGKYFGGKATAAEKNQIEAIAPQIIDLLERGQNWIENNAPLYLLYSTIQKSIFGLALINEISQAWDELKIEQQKLPISDFNQLLNEQIKDQPTPYVYERLGERYKHFFIDEFQDTSFLQFTNLLPLINNALSESGSCLLVGDAKQSIYAWRGGDASLFMRLAKKEKNQKITFANGHSLLAESQTLRLEKNFRSKAEIVNFNNELFSFIGNQLGGEEFSDLYVKAPQIPAKDPGGYVNVQLREKYEPDEILSEVATQIENLVNVEKAYNYRDICLLFRTNSEAREAVQFLLKREIPVVSGDALFVDSSPAVQWSLHFLKMYSRGVERERVWDFVKSYTEVFSIPKEKRHDLFSKLIPLPGTEFWEQWRELHPAFSLEQWKGKPLFALLESSLDAIGLLKEEDGYLQSFLDLALDYTRSKDGSISGFLSWWEEVGKKKTIPLPEDSEAVQILTMHKSKGLQFPVVFTPKIKWDLMRNDTRDWVPTELDELGSLDFYMGISSKNAEAIGGEYLETYTEALSQAVFDSVNTLYVALTRACDQLYVYAFPAKNAKDTLPVQDLIGKFVSQTQGGEEWISGNPSPSTKAEPAKVNTERKKWLMSHGMDSLKLSSSAPDGWTEGKTSPRYWGSLVHSMLQSQKQVEKALARGEISSAEAQQIKHIEASLKSHPDLASYYSESVRVLDERDLLIPNGGMLRPDRLVFTEEGDVVIIDYKTGEAKKSHTKQLNDYSDVLIQAGFRVKSRVLIYLSTQVVDVVSW